MAPMEIKFVASFSPIVADPDLSARLYRDTLGIDFEGQVGSYRFTGQLDGAKHFGLWPLSEAATACFGTATWPADRPTPQASLEFEVDDVAGAAATLERAGHALVHGPKEEPWGQTIARLLSADGLLVGVCVTPGLE